MFTGIIEEQGTTRSLDRKENLFRLGLAADKILPGIKIGDSVAVNGVCLTVTKRIGKVLYFDMMSETLKATTLKDIKSGDTVNLERAMKADSRFGGHFVTGHVDGVCRILRVVKLPNYVEFQVSIPGKLKRYLVPKGSVTLDGISLTVGPVKKNYFSVYLIPATLRITSFGRKMEGDNLNIETDILARYVL